MAFWGRALVVLGLLAGSVGVGTMPAEAAPAGTEAEAAPAQTAAADQQLVDRYAPVLQVRAQDSPCDDTGEPYVPMSVDSVLGNPQVALRQVGNGDAVITWGPTAKDLYGLGPGVYLDFPGDGLKPACIYATDSARYVARTGPVVYAHIARQADRPGLLAVQYWFYWYYNDWNDKHESDWEFVQVLFRVDLVEQALAGAPESIGLAQHEGGQASSWTSDAVARDGTHPVVYPSERSHATYGSEALFLGRGASEGFGCDNTEDAGKRLQPRAVLLPDTVTSADDPYAWLAFDGKWGERHAAPNDGPTGPMTKDRWKEPVTWQEGLRPSSFEIPGGSAGSPALVGAFCSVVGQGSVLFVDFVASPAKVLTVAAILVLLLGFLLRRTSWRRVPALPVVARRRAGELTRASLRLYGDRPLAFASLGSIALVIGVLAVVVSAVLGHLPGVGAGAAVTSDGPRSSVLLSAILAAPVWVVVLVLTTAAVSAMLEDQGTPVQALRAVGRRLGALVSTCVPAGIAIALLSLTVFGVPVAIWLAVRLQFLPQVVMIEGLRGRPAAERSAALVRGRWWHTGVIAFLASALVQLLAVLIGLLVLVSATGLPLWTVSAIAVACQVALAPLAALCLTLLYGDARADIDTRPTADLAAASSQHPG